MAALENPTVRRALSFGSGAGLWLGPHDLRAVIVRVRPNGPSLVAETVIHGYKARPAAEWGAELQKFLAAHEAGACAVMALLPREEILLRLVSLPGLSDEDTASAIRLQLDSLHPWGETEEVVFDWQRLRGTSTCAIALARRERIDDSIAMFAESGVALAGLTFLASAVYRASRLFAGVRQAPCLAVDAVHGANDGTVEVYGESEVRPFFSAQFDAPVETAVALSASEMRIEAPEEAANLFTLLPVTVAAPESADLSDQAREIRAGAYAAALTAACPHLGEPLNLLPQAIRKGTSKAAYLPAMILGSLLALLLLGLFAENKWLEKRHENRLEAETNRLEPAAKRLESIDRQTAAMAERIRLIDSFRKRPAADLDILKEINKLLPPPAFVQQVAIDDQIVLIAGEADQAEGLLKALDASPLFSGTEFTMPLNKGPNGEIFRLRTKREAGR